MSNKNLIHLLKLVYILLMVASTFGFNFCRELLKSLADLVRKIINLYWILHGDLEMECLHWFYHLAFFLQH